MAIPVSPAPSPRVSLRDIGLKLGVSHVTVSLALRGDPRISLARREEVQRVARELGYSPDPMLTSLSAYRQAKQTVSIKATIAWINQWEKPRKLRSLQEFDAYWNGAHDYATRLGYRLEEFVVGPGMSSQRLQQILLARTIRGILIPPHTSGLDLPGFDWGQFAVVRFGISVVQPRVHVVTSDQLQCAFMAFERMWERGYRRIGYLTSRRYDRNTGGNFRAGYLSAQDVHVPLRRHLQPLALSEENTPSDARNLERWLKAVKPDGVITAIPALPELLQQVGCRVPEDLGVAALSLLDGRFDAGIDQKSEEVGRVAMATLAGLIQQNERGIPEYCRRVLVEGRWVDGSSLPSRVAARV